MSNARPHPRLSKPTIFIASPGDVKAHRKSAKAVIDRIGESHALKIDSYVFEEHSDSFSAEDFYQAQIPSPADPWSIATICILGERLGKCMRWLAPELKPGGRQESLGRFIDENGWPISCDVIPGAIPLTGTVFEFLETLRASQRGQNAKRLFVFAKGDDTVSNASLPIEARLFGMRQLLTELSQQVAFTGNTSLVDYNQGRAALALFYDTFFAGERAGLITFTDDRDFRIKLEKVLRQSLNLDLDATQIFKGLGRYEIEDRNAFFGRGDDVAEVVRLLESAQTRGKVPFLLIHGKSGAGKSSFARAGLAGHLIERPIATGRRFVPVVIEPDEDGRLDGSVPTLWRLANILGVTLSLDSLTNELTRHKELPLESFCRVVVHHVRSLDSPENLTHPLIIIDQLERIMTGENASAFKKPWDEILGALVVLAHQRLAWIVACLPHDTSQELERPDDNYGLLDRWRDKRLIKGLSETGNAVIEFQLNFPGTEAKQRVLITRPFQALGIAIDDEVETKILEETRQLHTKNDVPILPLISIILQRVYEKYATRVASLEGDFENPSRGLKVDLSDIRGTPLKDAIEDAGNNALAKFRLEAGKEGGSSDAALETLWQLLRRMVTVIYESNHGEPNYQLKREIRSVGTAQGRTGLGPREAKLAKILVDARLFVKTHLARVRLLHESILDLWSAPRQWLKEEGEHRATLDLIDRAIKWREKGGNYPFDSEGLARAERLYLDWLGSPNLDKPQAKFIESLLFESHYPNLDSAGITACLFASMRAGRRRHAIRLLSMFTDKIDIGGYDKIHRVDTPLTCAARYGLRGVVFELIKLGADPARPDRAGWTILHEFASQGDYIGTERLVKQLQLQGRKTKQLLSGKTKFGGLNAIHAAAQRGCARTIRYLLWAQEADEGLEQRLMESDSGHLPIHYAARSGHLEAVRALLDREQTKQLVWQTTEGKTALIWAAQFGHASIVRTLINNAPGSQPRDNNGNTALHMAARFGHVEACEAVYSRFGDVDALDNDKQTPLHHAAKFERVGAAEMLLRVGGKPSIVDSKHKAPLHFACERGAFELVSVLVRYNADLDQEDGRGSRPIHIAAAVPLASYARCVQELVRGGASVVVPDKTGNRALHIAAWSGHIDSVKWILEGHSGEALMPNGKGNLAIHLAARRDRAHIAELLLADCSWEQLSAVNVRKRTPLHQAVEGGSPSCVTMFLEHGGRGDVLDDEGRSPLHLAARMGNAVLVGLLLEAAKCNNWSIDGGDDKGRTALHKAVQSQNPDVVQLLLRAGAAAAKADLFGNTPSQLADILGSVDLTSIIKEAE